MRTSIVNLSLVQTCEASTSAKTSHVNRGEANARTRKRTFFLFLVLALVLASRFHACEPGVLRLLHTCEPSWMCYCLKCSIKSYLNIPIFSFKSTQKFSGQNLQLRKKRVLPSQRPRGQYAFSRSSQQPISVRHEQKTSSAI